jgi:hypothetical protein
MLRMFLNNQLIDGVKREIAQKFELIDRLFITDYSWCENCDGMYHIGRDYLSFFEFALLRRHRKICSCRYSIIYDVENLTIIKDFGGSEIKYIIITKFGSLIVRECEVDVIFDVIQALGYALSEDFSKYLNT